MTSEERIRQQKDLVETMGRQFDKKGMQPVCGRILGLLTVMDKEQYTFDEIVEELQISKSSASTALRMLEMSGSIEYTTVPGDRKRYFHLKKLSRFAIIDEHVIKLKKSRDFLQLAMDLKANKQSENAIQLKHMIEMLDFFLNKFEELKKDFQGSV